jgi:hypothetical protein
MITLLNVIYIGGLCALWCWVGYRFGLSRRRKPVSIRHDAPLPHLVYSHGDLFVWDGTAMSVFKGQGQGR